MIDFAYSTFKRIIIHRIHQKEDNQDFSSVTYESELIICNEDVHKKIKVRINDACGKHSKSFNLEIANIAHNSFFNLAHNIFELSDGDFIDVSKKMADLLAKAQTTKNIREGYLIIIDAITDDEKEFIVVIKAEFHEAFKSNQKTIEILTDVFLSPSSKFFKIGILKRHITPDKPYPNSDFSCMIYDDQFRPGSQPAEFFCKHFLGFSIETNSKLLTQDFYGDVKKFIIDNIKNPVERRECISALRMVLIQDQTGYINPKEFAETFLPNYVYSSYQKKILTKEKYSRPFIKDIQLIKNSLQKRTINFPKKIVISGPESDFDNHVKQIETEDDIKRALQEMDTYTLIQIKGKPYTNE